MGIAAKVNVPLILGPGPGQTEFIVQDGSGVQFTMPSARFTSGGAPFNLRSGFTFTTQAAGRTDQYPEIQWVTPTPGASNVPTDIYLELGFSQPMDQQSVEASTLRLTDLDNDSHSFEIEIGLTETAGLIDLEWNDDSTILQLTTSHLQPGGGQFTLQPDNDYQLRMVVNKAKAAGANGLPLILGGSIDLRDGFTFTTSSPIEATPLQTLSGHSNIVWSVAYNRDGTLASASHDGTIRLWDAESGLELQTLSGHNGPISSVAYSPDGTTLASASFDGSIKLWHAESGLELQTLSGHSDIVFSVAYSPDGTTLASASFSVLAQQALNEDFHDPQVTTSLSNIQLWEVAS